MYSTLKYVINISFHAKVELDNTLLTMNKFYNVITFGIMCFNKVQSNYNIFKFM